MLALLHFVRLSFVLFQVPFELLQYMLRQYDGFYLESIFSSFVGEIFAVLLLVWSFRYPQNKLLL